MKRWLPQGKRVGLHYSPVLAFQAHPPFAHQALGAQKFSNSRSTPRNWASSGQFCYYGENQLWREMKCAVEAAFGPGGDFLERFKAYGWYLGDLVLRPINDLPRAERKKACLEAQDTLLDLGSLMSGGILPQPSFSPFSLFSAS
jgi:hypothetical protein